MSGRGDSDLFSFLVSMNDGIMIAIETYIASTTETYCMNGGIITLLEIDIMSITEHDNNGPALHHIQVGVISELLWPM